MYKAVISDLDGTLLSRGHHVTKFTKNVIKEIIKKRNKFFILPQAEVMIRLDM